MFHSEAKYDLENDFFLSDHENQLADNGIPDEWGINHLDLLKSSGIDLETEEGRAYKPSCKPMIINTQMP